ncbi:MAG TPA: hypothetical protein VLS89_07090 [Candidatus Nanopelagicales bacterium]|nr:hypothetical protein [Candidatus Nanopelagicales bacterium]
MVDPGMVQAAAVEIAGLIEAGVTRVGLSVPAGADKRALLGRIEASLSGRRQVVRMELPDGDDAGMVALGLGAAQLEVQYPGLLEHVRSPEARWRTKLEKLRAAVEKASGPVILIDEPRFEPAVAPQEELFARRAIELTEALLDVRGATVVLVSRWIPPGVARMVKAPAHEASAAPLVDGLLRALAAAGVAVENIPKHHRRLELLVEHDLGRLALDDEALRLALLRLSVLRVPFPAALLDRVAPSLSAASRRVLELLLSSTSEGMRALPDALGRLIRARQEQGARAETADPAWQTDEPIGEMHRLAAEHHREQFERARAGGDVLAAVRHELEEIHHLTEASDAEALLSRSLWFVDQYNALGKALSKKALRAPRDDSREEEALRLQAIQAYERALAHDEQDAYAHHYIAYNLDILARDPARAEREYVVARDLEPAHAWYHSRYIRFLITTAWMTEARAAWERAFDGLGSPLGLLDYAELHGQVARLLLHRGELDFAREVLENVPEERRGAPWWRALMRLLVYLEEERDESLVFPPSLSVEERWVGPHLVSASALPRVKRWRPGRVVDRDERDVHLRVAERGAEDQQVSITYVHLSRWRLKEVWGSRLHRLPPGTFVELIDYKDGTHELRAWSDKESAFHDAALPRLFPAPDRYIRRGFARP